MPIKREAVGVESTDYGTPFVGPVDHTVGINILMSGLTTAEVDTNGVLKPGVPLLRTGALISTTAQSIWGCVAEATKVATMNDATALTAAGTQEVAVVTEGAINRDILEDILGRALTANELSAFAAAGCLIKLYD